VEVPLGLAVLRRQQLVDRRLRRALGRHLLEHRELHAVVLLAEAGDLLRAARLLRAEVVRGEAEHDEVLALIVLVQLLEAGVLGREAALRGGVDHQRDLALIGRERLGLAGERVDREIV
jgi:hypothetical protein